MRQRGTVVLKHRQGQLVTRAIGRDALGTPALSRRALSLVHSLGRYSRVSTRVCPLRETYPKEMATWQ